MAKRTTKSAEDQAPVSQPVLGFSSVVNSINQVTGLQVKLSGDIYWYESLKRQLAGTGWEVEKVAGSVAVQAKHVAVFNMRGILSGVVLEGNTIIENETGVENVAPYIVQRLRLTNSSQDEE